MNEFVIEKDGKLSEKILNFYNGAVTYSLAMKTIRKKDVKVNGARVNKDCPVKKGDFITVYLNMKDNRADKVIFNENGVIAFEKPKGITSDDFYSLVLKTYPQAKYVHRLDRNTDGIILFALTDEAYAALTDGFKRRTFKKYYYAVVYGVPKKRSDLLTAYLVKNAEKSEVKIYDEKVAGAEKIITGYETLWSKDGISGLKVELVTGKTHQIRAHLSHVGLPLIGDEKYGDRSINERFKKNKQSLTAYRTELYFDKSSPLYLLNGKVIELPVQIEKM